jgi:hypothetical protein
MKTLREPHQTKNKNNIQINWKRNAVGDERNMWWNGK